MSKNSKDNKKSQLGKSTGKITESMDKAVAQIISKAKKSEGPTPGKGKWWADGIQFECQGSGQCCLSRGEYGYVYLTKDDRVRMAGYLNLKLTDFNKKYCDRTKGVWHLKEDAARSECTFLEGKKCGVYGARPTQCRTWPFWPEVMNAKAWKKDVAEFCPGVGKGRVWSAAEIQKNLDEQSQSEKSIIADRK